MLSPLILVTLCVLAAAAVASVRRIPEGQVLSLRRPGGQVRILGSGTHLVFPLVERVAHRINLAGNRVAFTTAVGDRDCHASVYYQVLDPERAEAVIDGVDAWFRSRGAERLAEPELPPSLGERRLWLKRALNAEAADRGLMVTRVDLSPAD
jgi:regulator of protease activity HflC (stomatin/prohibitin superfamily)